jgi:uncharacterized protein (TIGR00299 family) protein
LLYWFYGQYIERKIQDICMRFAYLDCFAGISGDMFLGALLDAGVAEQVLHDAAAAMHLGVRLKVERVDRSGISGTKVHVLDGDEIADAPRHAHPHVPQEMSGSPEIIHRAMHNPVRSLSDIRKLIEVSSLDDEVKSTASGIFALLGSSEAKIHNAPLEEIHFHEVGAVDAIVDIVCAAAGIHALGVDRWFCSSVNVGGGMVDCAHGRFPVPAPATADLLRGMPTYSAHIQKELVTPTGAAILKALDPTFGPQPAMRVESIGYGAGTRNPEGFANVLRLSLGVDAGADATESVTVLETALDDLSPQILAHVTERALALGALDVMTTAVQMKKGRMGMLLTILTDDEHRGALERLVLAETSTLGLRVRRDRRVCLERSFTTVNTDYGAIRIKIGSFHGEELNAAPEFEDCRAAAAEYGVPVKRVLHAAQVAYINTKS